MQRGLAPASLHPGAKSLESFCFVLSLDVYTCVAGGWSVYFVTILVTTMSELLTQHQKHYSCVQDGRAAGHGHTV